VKLEKVFSYKPFKGPPCTVNAEVLPIYYSSICSRCASPHVTAWRIRCDTSDSWPIRIRIREDTTTSYTRWSV